MQQEPDVIEKIDDEDIAALADLVNEVLAEDLLEEGVSAEETQGVDASGEESDSESITVAHVDHMRLIEALLFASAEPLTVNAIRERMPEGADVGGLLMELQKTYEGRGVVLLNMEGYWAFRTATDLGDALSMKKDVQRKLSKAAMETLAIVAYHQPVTRPEIENIRGVAISNGTLDVLMECGWVKPGRRRETPGRPLTWVTTPAFLDHFGLSALNDLPGMDELKASGLLDSRPALAVTTGNLFGAEDEMLAGDLEDSDIAGQDAEDEMLSEEEGSDAPIDAEAEGSSDVSGESEPWESLAASNDDGLAESDEEEVA